MGERVTHAVNPAALPCGVQYPRDGGLQSLAGVRDHQFDTARAEAGQRTKEFRTENLRLGAASGHAQDLTAPAVIGADGDGDGGRDDPPAFFAGGKAAHGGWNKRSSPTWPPRRRGGKRGRLTGAAADRPHSDAEQDAGCLHQGHRAHWLVRPPHGDVQYALMDRTGRSGHPHRRRESMPSGAQY